MRFPKQKIVDYNIKISFKITIFLVDCNIGGYFKCQNGGICQTDGSCFCKDGFTGFTCLNGKLKFINTRFNFSKIENIYL